MPGSVESIALTAVVLNEKLLEQLPEEHDPRDLILENGFTNKKLTGETAKEDGEIVLGKNMHSTCFDITEPNEGDEISGDREAYMAGVVTKYQQFLTEKTKHHLGYPFNLDFNYTTLAPLQPFSINNLGDPFIESNYGVHSRQFEVGVLDWFARLWEIEKEEYWGYITNGGTEGNLHGILVGREVLPDGVLYVSKTEQKRILHNTK